MSEKLYEVTLGTETFQIIKKGYAQAEQVVRIGQWLSKYGFPALSKVAPEGEIVLSNGYDVFSKILDVLDPEALIDLFMIVVGCNHDLAMEHFDIAILIDAGLTVYEEQPSFKRVISRFFSSAPLKEVEKEDSSMTLEEPTDGPTK
jgi:hypothetical protein